jgi:predicted peptidase
MDTQPLKPLLFVCIGALFLICARTSVAQTVSPALNDGEKVVSEGTLAKQQSRALAGFSMGGSGSVYLSIMHPELFCAAGSMGGGLRRRGEQIDDAIQKAIPVWKKNDFGFFLVNGDNDRPDAFKEFSVTLKENGIEHRVLILPDTKHNLGLYYERSVRKLLAFIGRHFEE